jgi:hypothetical protein
MRCRFLCTLNAGTIDQSLDWFVTIDGGWHVSPAKRNFPAARFQRLPFGLGHSVSLRHWKRTRRGVLFPAHGSESGGPDRWTYCTVTVKLAVISGREGRATEDPDERVSSKSE